MKALAGAAIRTAGMVTLACVAESVVEPKATPLQKKCVLLLKPVPVTVTVVCALPGAKVAGVIPVRNGTGLAGGATPVPLSATVCGLEGSLSLMVSVPVRVPPVVGVNVTWIVQLEETATLAPQLFVSPKSPDAEMLEIVSGAEPLFVSVTGCGALVVPVF